MMEKTRFDEALGKLQALCSKKECCSSEILSKAVKLLEGDTEAAGELLERLKEDSYVDDLRYASAFAREKSSLTGWGPVKISVQLRMKGIPKETINAALAEVDPEAAGNRMEKLMAAKWKTLQGDPYAKFKLIKYALTRGYDYDCVAPVAESLSRQSLSEDSQ